jgi:hypothetical protein
MVHGAADCGLVGRIATMGRTSVRPSCYLPPLSWLPLDMGSMSRGVGPPPHGAQDIMRTARGL